MTTIRPARAEDVDRIAALGRQAFNPPAAFITRMRERFKPETARVAEHNGSIAATLRILRFGHYYGGKAVPAAGISGVAVAAEARGKGVGSAMVAHTMRELRAEGLPLSSLYPATVPIYREAGYGFGGVRTDWKASQVALPQGSTLDLEPFDDDAQAEVAACYAQVARAGNGLMERADDWWADRVWQTDDDSPMYRYLVREDDEVTGYIAYSLGRKGDSWRSNMGCRDLVWTTPAAGRALLSIASLHRSTGGDLVWSGPPSEPLGDLIREDVPQLAHAFRWMLRLLDVPAAIEARGYNPLVESSVTIGVTDPLFAENAGPWRIDVSGGQAKVSPADHADATVTIQTLASIYASLHRAADARRTGGLRATEDAAAALDLIFSGPTPWLADFF